MADGQLRAVVSELRRLMGGQGGSSLTDAQLVEDFVGRRDERSFEVLVWRHSTMVLSLCQRMLRDGHLAEDAFQATFLVFARKAGSIGTGDAVGSWLYKVAFRTVLRLRTKTGKAAMDLGNAALDEQPARAEADEVLWCDLRPVIDEEIDRLPEKFRKPFVLCYLQGQTNKEAAEQLGCPEGTILSRLARGRERLRSRLALRGVALSAVALSTAVAQQASAATVPGGAIHATMLTAIPFAAGQAAGLVPASVAALAEGVLHTMFVTKLKIVAAALVAFTILGTGVGSVAHWALADNAPRQARVVAALPDPVEEDYTEFISQERRPDPGPSAIVGKVIAIGTDGKSFILETAPRGRGDDAVEAKKIDIKLGDKTVIIYQGVGTGGAKLTQNHGAEVRLEENSKDVAARVTFIGPEAFGRRRPDLAGRVVAVPGTQIITLEVPSPRPREEDGKKVDLKFTEKTFIVYSRVGKGGTMPKEGYAAQVWLEDGQGTTVHSIHFAGTEAVEERGGPEADFVGRIAAVSKDGATITLEHTAPPPRTRDERPAETKRMDVKISDKTAIAYNMVGPDGTKLAAGQQARVWLEAGSKDAAAKLSIAGTLRERGTQIGGKVAGIAADGLSFTIESPPKARGEGPTHTEIKLTAKTRIAYFGVGPDEAKLTDGYFAQVRVDEAKGPAVEAMLSKGGDRGR